MQKVHQYFYCPIINCRCYHTQQEEKISQRHTIKIRPNSNLPCNLDTSKRIKQEQIETENAEC